MYLLNSLVSLAMLSIRRSLAYSYETLQQNPLGEIAGSLGDLGTLLPLLTALTASHAVSLTSTLVFSGIFNILSGAFFGIPIVVQPMKAIASISLARSFSQKETMAAGIGVGLVVLLLAVTNMLSRAAVLVPIPIIKGIQVGAGLSLVLNAGTTLSKLEFRGSNWDDNIFWAMGAFFILYSTTRKPHFPFALALFCLGVLFAAIQLAKNGHSLPNIGIWMPFLPTVPTRKDFVKGFGIAGVGQLPLTILNSVIAVTALSEDLLPSRPAPSVTALGVSVGLMNLTGCWFGAMPVCHGSGGLAAQYRFGARSGASVMVFGLFKLVLGLIFGESLAGLLEKFPKSLLGLMVFATGMELVSVGENLNTSAKDVFQESSSRVLTARAKKERWMIMMVTGGMMIAFSDALIGFLAGCLCTALLKLQDRVEGLSSGGIDGVVDEASELLRA